MKKFKQLPLGKQFALLLVLALVSTIIPGYVFGLGARGDNGYYFNIAFSVQGDGGSIVTYVFAPDANEPDEELYDVPATTPAALLSEFILNTNADDVVPTVGDGSLQVEYGTVIQITAVPYDGFVVEAWGIGDYENYNLYHVGENKSVFYFTITDDVSIFVRFTHDVIMTQIPIAPTSYFRTAPMVSVGAAHAVALRDDGIVFEWEIDRWPTGNYQTHNHALPVQVAGIYNVLSVSAGTHTSRNFTVAVKGDGTVWEWGRVNAALDIPPTQITGLYDIIAVTAGSNAAAGALGGHKTALRSDGTVWEWHTSNTGIHTITRVDGLSGIIGIAAGEGFSVALRYNGTVWTWGTNNLGILAQVQGTDNAIAIDAGGGRALAVRNDGTVWEWSYAPISIPVQATGFYNATVASICGGGIATIKNDGTIWHNGTHHIAVQAQSLVHYRVNNLPYRDVDDISPMIYVSRGAPDTVAVREDGYVWIVRGSPLYPIRINAPDGAGYLNLQTKPSISIALQNANGAVGREIILRGTMFSTVVGANPDTLTWSTYPSDALQVVASSSTPSAARANSYRLYTTIMATKEGIFTVAATAQDGTSTTVTVRVSGNATGFTTPPMVSAGDQHTLALRYDGTVWAYGAETFGTLGDGTTRISETPIQVQNLGNVIAVSAGRHQSKVLQDDGTVWAWGRGIGEPNLIERHTPVQVRGLNNVVKIDTGNYHHSLALKQDGTLWTWGWSHREIRGDGTNYPCPRSLTGQIPAQVPNISGVIDFAVGRRHTLILKEDGTVWRWGEDRGQERVGTLEFTSLYPVQVPNLSNVIAVSTRGYHSVALRDDGTVWVWGYNVRGIALGVNSTESVGTRLPVPVQVSGLSNVIEIVAGLERSYAIKDDGTVWAWGSLSISPVQISHPNNVRSLSVNGHSIALREDGSVWELGGFLTSNSYFIYVPGPNGVGRFFLLPYDGSGETPIPPGGGTQPPDINESLPGGGTPPANNEPPSGGGAQSPSITEPPHSGDTPPQNQPRTMLPLVVRRNFEREFFAVTATGNRDIPATYANNSISLFPTNTHTTSIIHDATNIVYFDLGDTLGVTSVSMIHLAWQQFASAGMGIQFILPHATVTIDSDAVYNIVQQVGNDRIDVSILPVSNDIFSVSISSNGTGIVELDGYVVIRISTELPPPISVFLLAEDGINVEIPTIYYNGYVTFQTNVVGEFLIINALANTEQYTAGLVSPLQTLALRLVIGSTTFTHFGAHMQNDVAPFIDRSNNRTMVPLRVVAEGLDAPVRFERDTRTAYITLVSGQEIAMPIDVPLPNGMGTPVIINNRTFVPARYVSEVLGATVRWDGNAQAVYIYR